MILTDFDSNRKSTFEPEELVQIVPNFPKIGITCFSNKLIKRYVEIFNGIEIATISSANGKVPIFKINYEGMDIALFMSRVGALACTTSYEEVLAMGLDKLIMFGTCGVLDRNIEDFQIG